MATQTPRSVDRTVEKMLRKANQSSRTRSGAVGSPASAAQALAQMAEIQKFVARGDVDTAQTIALKSAQAKASPGQPGNGRTAAETSGDVKARPAAASPGSRGLMMWSCVACGLAILLVGGLFSGMILGGSHSVSGVVMLDKRPLAGVEVSFCPKGGSGKSVCVKTTERGKFSIDGIPAGEYRIFLAPGDGQAELPQRYLSAESTPFQIRLTSDRADLRMLASSERKKSSR